MSSPSCSDDSGSTGRYAEVRAVPSQVVAQHINCQMCGAGDSPRAQANLGAGLALYTNECRLETNIKKPSVEEVILIGEALM